MPIYTKKGDKGQTGLPGDRRLSKTDQLFEVLGYFDQTNAQIGLAIALMKKEGDTNPVEMLEKIQAIFLTLGSSLAAEKPLSKESAEEFTKAVAWLEGLIDRWDSELPPLRNFILAGGTEAGAALHLVRTSVRQAERHFHRLPTPLKFPEVAQYLNRLSDFFFQAARYYNFRHDASEAVWKPTKH